MPPPQTAKRTSTQASIQALSNEEPVTLHSQENVPFTVPNFLANYFKPNLPSPQAMNFAKLMEDKHKKQVGRVWQNICKNCYVAGRGLRGHRLAECQALGHSCALVCSRCRQGARWASGCKNKVKK